MKVLTSAEMRAVDDRTAAGGVSLAELMEHAGAAVAKFVERQYPQAGRVMVLCGKGNNGGDGLVAARYLAAEGIGVRVLLLARQAELKGEAAAALAALLEATSEEIVEEAVDEAAVHGFAELFGEAELLVDAMVGTGFKPPLRGAAAAARELVNGLAVPVVAVDLPSGWDADSTEQHSSEAMRADAVVTFTAPKRAHVFGHLTRDRTFGPVVVAAIGSPEAVIDEVVAKGEDAVALTWTGAAKAITERRRVMNSNKGMYGHVLLVAGSYGKSGAPAMASLAGLRAGAGLVTAAVPESILATVALVTPELMTVPLAQGAAGEAALAAIEGAKLGKLMKGIKVLAIGPGLSTEGEAPEFVHQLIARTCGKDAGGDMETAVPVVIDADGLNAFAGKTELLAQASGKASGATVLRTLVLTPHPGEMARLMGTDVKTVEADRVGNARRFATEHGVTLVLKGWRTLVGHPDGRVAVNTSGNPSMAKGGSGDILTGIVAAMLGQYGDDVASAVEAAVYLHGLAADFAVVGEDGQPGRDEHTVLATDTVAHLTDAFRYRVRDEDGGTWICGVRAGGEVEVGV